MSRLTFFIAATLAWISANAGTAAVPDDDRTAAVLVVTNCARLAEISTTNDGVEERFDLTAQAISVAPHRYAEVVVRDGSAAISLHFMNDVGVADVRLLGVGRFQGYITREFDSAYFFCDGYEFIKEGEPPAVEEISAESFFSGKYDYMKAVMHGEVRDVFPDENDPRYFYLTLLTDGRLVYCAVCVSAGEDLGSLVCADVVVKGTVTPYVHRTRSQIGRTFQIGNVGNIRVVKPAPSDPFAVSEMPPCRCDHPSSFAMLGRRRMAGRVLAAWDSRRLLIASRDGHVSNVDLADAPPPVAGDFVEIAGFPETDLYRVNFTRAIWRKCGESSFAKASAAAQALADKSEDKRGMGGRAGCHAGRHCNANGRRRAGGLRISRPPSAYSRQCRQDALWRRTYRMA